MAKKAAKGKKKGSKKAVASAGGAGASATASDPVAEARLWATRFELSEAARKEHRENASLLVRVNANMEREMQSAETDAIEVVSHLRKELAQANDELKAAREQVKETRRQTRLECEAMEDECATKIRQVTLQLNDKAAENEKLKKELHLLNEFRQRREELEEEVQELQELNRGLQREHERTVQRMETKFFEEKSRMQKNMERQLVELTAEAHHAAVAKLDETTRATYEENVRLVESVRLHTTDAAQLQQTTARLSSTNEELRQELAEKNRVIQTSVSQANSAAGKVQTLKAKVQTMESTLSEMLTNHARDLEKQDAAHVAGVQQYVSEITALQEALDVKAAELKRIRFLSRNMLDQRSEVEQFFLESIAAVKREIASARTRYKQAVRTQYSENMRAAHMFGQGQPVVRDLTSRGFEAEFQRAEERANVDISKVDIGQMTWEQRESVLRSLLAKINGAEAARRKARRPSGGVAAAASATTPPRSTSLTKSRIAFLPALTAPPRPALTAPPAHASQPGTAPHEQAPAAQPVFLTQSAST